MIIFFIGFLRGLKFLFFCFLVNDLFDNFAAKVKQNQSNKKKPEMLQYVGLKGFAAISTRHHVICKGLFVEGLTKLSSNTTSVYHHFITSFVIYRSRTHGVFRGCEGGGTKGILWLFGRVYYMRDFLVQKKKASFVNLIFLCCLFIFCPKQYF
jgi:hypothetical protein